MVALSSKIVNETEENRKLYIVQTWLGLVLSLLWAVLFVYKAGMERKVELEQDSVNPTASDFTVMIEDLPKVYNRANLQAMLMCMLQVWTNSWMFLTMCSTIRPSTIKSLRLKCSMKQDPTIRLYR